MNRVASLLIATMGCPLAIVAEQDSVPTFGTTVVVPGGLCGEIFHIKKNSPRLPRFETLKKPRGTVFTGSLNIPPQHFQVGFPGVTDRFEWFAIDYIGKFWISKPGMYRFLLTSDDGARLYVDDQLIADNDGIHSTLDRESSLRLGGGIHKIRISYFQGPGDVVSLVLRIAGPGEKLRVFSTDEFKPPSNPEAWTFPDSTPAMKPESPAQRKTSCP